MPLYYLDNSRSEEQRTKMQRLEAASICIFCPEYLANDPVHPELLRTRHWTVIANRFPYHGTRQHLLLIPDVHVADIGDLPEGAQLDFWEALKRVRHRFTITHYGLGIRNGEPRFTGGTIEHLHVHLVIGDVDDPGHEPVRMKLSSKPRRPANS